MQRIVFSTTLLACDSLAVGRIGPFDMAFNGAPIVQVEQLLRDDGATVFGRGDGPAEFGFSINAFFASHAAAVAFCATHRDLLPVQDDLSIVDEAEGLNLVLADAVREVRFSQIHGRMVRVDYKFTGTRFVSSEPPEIPGDTDIVKAVEIDLAMDDEEKAVTFDAPFTSKPRFVQGIVSAPDGGKAIFAIPRESTRAAEGITFDFTAKIPAAGYVLLVNAIL